MARKTTPAARPAVTPQQQARANVAAKVKAGVGVTLHTSGAPIKGLLAQPLPKPNLANTRVIASMGKHPGGGNCVKRWHLYKPGLSIAQAMATPGLTPNDLTFWAKCGYLTLRAATPKEFAAAQQAYAAQQAKAAAPAPAAPSKPRAARKAPAKAAPAPQVPAPAAAPAAPASGPAQPAQPAPASA